MLIDFRNLFPKYNINPKGVLHIGANVGEEAPIYNQLGITDVYWIEANYNLISKLKQNVDPFYHKVITACIGDSDGQEVVFNISNNAGQSSSYLEFGTHKTAHPDVHYTDHIIMKTCRIDTIFNVHRLGIPLFDFLNIDLQGAELKALKGMGELLHQFKWAYLEVNKEELYKGCALVGEIDEYMLTFGFKRVETKWCGNTGWGDALYIK